MNSSRLPCIDPELEIYESTMDINLYLHSSNTFFPNNFLLVIVSFVRSELRERITARTFAGSQPASFPKPQPQTSTSKG